MGYCNVMCNKVEEGLAVAREVKDNHPTDDSVLSAMALTFRHGKAEVGCCDFRCEEKNCNEAGIH
jgi:hypothetical protein